MDIQKEREEFEKLPAVAELIKTNNVWWSDAHGDYFGSDHELDCWIDGAWAVWQAKSQAVPEWISVDEQEPECGETVLVCWADALDVDPEMDFMDIDVETGAYYWSNCEADKPTHWMPLPKVIKAQERSQ